MKSEAQVTPRREAKEIECKHCSRRSVGLFYAGLVCWGYLCTLCARRYSLTPVIPYAAPVAVQAPTAR